MPFARYVLENAGQLQFPLRRYQIQKCWRGERPQEGRYREFPQADIDVVGVGRAAVPLRGRARRSSWPRRSAALPLPRVRMQVNNRKLSQGFFRGLGARGPGGRPPGRRQARQDRAGRRRGSCCLEPARRRDARPTRCLAFAAIQAEDASFADRVARWASRDPLLDEGMAELVRVVEAARAAVAGVRRGRPAIARGLDYYTGTVYETQLVGHEALGSVCSGGRYDALASDGDTRTRASASRSA